MSEVGIYVFASTVIFIVLASIWSGRGVDVLVKILLWGFGLYGLLLMLVGLLLMLVRGVW